MTLPALATLLLCLFTALLIAARPAVPMMSRTRAVAAVVAAFVVGAALAMLLRPATAFLAMSVGILCAVSLLRALSPALCAALAGLCAGLGVVGLFPAAEYGAIVVPVWLAGLAAPLAALRLKSSRAEFAPPMLVDQGQCAMVIAAPVIAALPGAEEGWRSALALAGAQSAAGDAAPGAWLLLPLLALAAGMFHQVWSQK